MARCLTVLLAVCVFFGNAGAGAGEDGRPLVLVTIFPLHQIARNVAAGRDALRLELLLAAAAGCPHDYALTPGEMSRLSRADALVVNGLGMEEFLAAALEQAGGDIAVFDTSSSAGELLPDNPHLFASPLAEAAIAGGMAEFFASLDPEGAETYRANAERYAAEMRALAREMTAAAASLPGRRFVASHGVFDYLARDIGLEIVGDVGEGEAGVPAARLRALAETIRAQDALAVLVEPNIPARASAALAEAAGVPVVPFDPVATGEEDAPPDYFAATMRNNMRMLAGALAPAREKE